jgi:DNA-binding NtrC family response regulator
MLSGIRILIVEDEALIAAALSQAVEDAEGEVVGVATSVSEARQMIKQRIFDAAVLDLHLTDGEVTPVLEALHARKAPTVVYSGSELPEKIRERHPELVVLRKPVLPARIVAEILRAPETGLIKLANGARDAASQVSGWVDLMLGVGKACTLLIWRSLSRS